MFKRCFLLTVISILTFVACTKDVQDPGLQSTRPAVYGSVHSLSVGIESGAYMPEDGGTKASTEAIIRVKWEQNDEVSVVNATTGKILGGCLKATESGENVVFSGTVEGTINNNDVLYYVYPRIAQNDGEIAFDQDGCDVSLANQTYDGLNANKVCFFGFAKDQASSTSTSTAISRHIKFTLVTSYAHLNMSNLPAAGFNLSSIDISNVNKGFTWSLSDNTLSTIAYGENEGISVNCTNTKITKAGNAVVRFAIPASSESSVARVVTVNKAYTNDKYVKDELKSSAYYNQLYTSWKSNVSVSSESDKTKVTVTSDGSTDVAEGVIPVADAFVADKETEIGIGGVGTVTFDATATAKIKSNADVEGSTNVFFKVEDVTETKPVQDANLVYEVTMKTVDEQGVEVFSTEKAAGVATVTVPLGEEVASVTSVALVNESGVVIEGGVVPESVHFENGILTFNVNHFSKYAIKYTVNEGNTYVAQIGNSKYTTLARAIDAAQNGNTIQMIADFATTDEVTVGADKNIILDLNGKTISYTTNGCGAFITNCGYLKITDSSNGKNGKITACHNPNWMDGCYTIDNSGQPSNYDKASTLIIEAGTIENTSPQGLAWPVNNGSWGTKAELIINGGTIHSVNYVPVREYLFYNGKKTIVINGGKFISDNSRAIAVQVNEASIQDTGSSVTINGGEFTCNGSGILYIDLHAANVDMTGFTMTVNGGKFKNSNTSVDVLVYDDEGNTQTSAVLLSNILKGGIYSKEPAPELIPFGYHIEENTDSQTSSAYPWRVAANPAANAEVSISKPGQTTVFSTLAAFRDETNAGNTFAGYTVTLLKDIDLTDGTWIPIGTFDDGENPYMYFGGIFDGGGHKISLKKTGISGDYGLFMTIGKKRSTELTIVKNLNLAVDLTSNSTNKTYIGGLADTIYGNVELENITVEGQITTGCYAGSLAGFAIEFGTATIKNCTNKADITVVAPSHATWSCVGGLVAQFDYTSVNFINCRNEGKLSADHSKMTTQGASYMGHMIAKGNYKNSPHDLIIENCSFSDGATIIGWNKQEGDYHTYPFEGKIACTEEYSYGSGTPNLGKQMVGGYFKSCSLNDVIQNNIYPNGNSDVE